MQKRQTYVDIWMQKIQFDSSVWTDDIRAFLRRSGAKGQVCILGVGSVKAEACEVLTMPMNLIKFVGI